MSQPQPINYVDALIEYYGAMGHPPYQWTVNENAPLHHLNKPLNECTVSILVSGGVSACGVPGFNPDARNDHRLDEVPSDFAANNFQIHDSYYDHTDAEADINCIFPLERLREMAEEGKIGAVAKRLWSGFMGRIYNRSKVIEESAPQFAQALIADEVDLLIASPS